MHTKSFIISMVLLFGAISFTANATDWNPFPDTGQTLCYNVAGDIIACPAEGEALYGQDAQYAGLAQNFQDNGDNTVTDLNTTLIWQNSDDGLRNWEDAMDYCAILTLGTYDDWRLPEIIELQSIADYSGVSPAINPIFSCQPFSYWSATTYPPHLAPAWIVYFGFGSVTTYNKIETFYVRCVRAGRPPGSFDLSVILAGSGSGEVHFTPPDETCTTSCSKNYITSTEVTLTAAADVSSSFSGWSGGGCSGTGNCVTTVDQAMDVTATFTLHSYTLTYTAEDVGEGSTNGSISGISPQEVDYDSNGSSVTAVPNANYHFVQWSDGSPANPRTDTNVTAHITVSARFTYYYNGTGID